MSKPGLLAQVHRATGQADNVVRLPSPADPVPSTAAPAPNAPEDYGDELAALDELLQEQEQRAAGTDTAPVGRNLPVLHSQAPAGVPTPATGGPLTPAEAVELGNKEHFIAPLSGESTIWHEGLDAETGLYAVVPVSTNSVRLKYAPYSASVVTPGGVKSIPAYDLWVRSKKRREYPGGVVFQPEGATPPGVLNTWRGFGVARIAGDASPMIDHAYMLCGGVTVQAEYLLNWLAFLVQRPGTRPEVAVVLRGGQGTGKGTLIRPPLKMFGPHGLHITQPKHLTGNFNAHLRTTRFLFVDEGYWAGDKAAEGVLKGLITEPTIAIEMKGRDVFTAQNRLAVAMAANGAWVVPAGADERRYFVVDVPPTRAQDHSYFGKLNSWIDGDGAAIFLDHLLTRDLSGFNVRAVPKTAALDRQKIEAMPVLDRWLMESLDTGTGMAGDEWTEAPHRVMCNSAGHAFETYCRRAAVRGVRVDSRGIGRRLHEVFGCGAATMNRTTSGTQRGWTLPGITQARSMAAAAFGLAHYVWGQA